jgi:hypothetical protein
MSEKPHLVRKGFVGFFCVKNIFQKKGGDVLLLYLDYVFGTFAGGWRQPPAKVPKTSQL